jgi:hypothetical protein
LYCRQSLENFDKVRFIKDKMAEYPERGISEEEAVHVLVDLLGKVELAQDKRKHHADPVEMISAITHQEIREGSTAYRDNKRDYRNANLMQFKALVELVSWYDLFPKYFSEGEFLNSEGGVAAKVEIDKARRSILQLEKFFRDGT